MMFEEKLTNKSIRKVNQEKALRIVLREKRTTRKVIAEEAQISLMTVKSIVDNLLHANILVEKDVDHHESLGRRPKLLQLSPHVGVIACINLSFKEYFDYHLYNVHGELLLRKRVEQAPQKTYRDSLTHLAALILADIQGSALELVSIGILVPGAYYEQADTVNFDLIAGLKELPIKRFFREQFNIDNVGIFHDVFAGAQAEYEASLPRSDSMFYFFAGDGIGGAFINGNGTWLRGENLLAGEIGQCIVGSGDTEQILEECASTYKITQRMKVKMPVQDFGQALAMYEAADDAAMEAIDAAATAVANSLHNVIWTLNPGRVVIASPYRSYAEIILKACQKRTRRFADLAFPVTVDMGLSQYADYGEICGCFSLSLTMWLDSLLE